MKPSPAAIHAAFFGVFPHGEIDADLRESFTASKAHGAMKDITAMMIPFITPFQMPADKDPIQIQLEMEDFDHASQDLAELHRSVAARLRSAYKMASEQGWIKPTKGVVLTHNEILPAFDRDLHLLTLYTEGRRPADFEITVAHDTPPLAEIVYVRAVLDGQPAAMSHRETDKPFFRLLQMPKTELEMPIDRFPLTPIDTIRHCNETPSLRRSSLMGFTP